MMRLRKFVSGNSRALLRRLLTGQPVIIARSGDLASSIRELGVKKRWGELLTLVKGVSVDELVQKCRNHAHKTRLPKEHGEKRNTEVSVQPRLDNAFTDIVEAHLHSRESGHNHHLWRIMEMTYSDPVLAESVGVRRLLRVCAAEPQAAALVAADEQRLLKVLSLWILRSPDAEQRRTFVGVFMRSIRERTGAQGRDVALAIQLLTVLRGTLDEEGTKARSAGKDPPSQRLLGDVLCTMLVFWSKLNLAPAVSCGYGTRLIEGLAASAAGKGSLIPPQALDPSQFSLAVTFALRAGQLGRSRSDHPAAGGIKSAPRRATEFGASSTSPPSSPTSPSPATVNPAPASDASGDPIPEADAGTDAALRLLKLLLGLAPDNSVESLRLRQRFFAVLVANEATSSAILTLGQGLAGSDADKAQLDKDGGESLLLGTGPWNAILEAHAAAGRREECFRVLDRMNAERKSTAAALAFAAAQTQLPPNERSLIAFGPNVFSYIETANSKRSSTAEIRARRMREWPATMARLFDRMGSDGVQPDMRMLFNFAEAARELHDFDFVLRVIERAHILAQKPRKKALSSDALHGGLGTGSVETPWQPHTSLPVRGADEAAARYDGSSSNSITGTNSSSSSSGSSSSSSSSSGGGDGIVPVLQPRGEQYVATLQDFQQIYHYGISVAFRRHQPDDSLTLLLMMVSSGLQPSAPTMYSVLRCLANSDSPSHLEEVVRLFGLMPQWGVKRDEAHATCFVEALAKLGRVGDACAGLDHVKGSPKALDPRVYSTVAAHLLVELAKTLPAAAAAAAAAAATAGASGCATVGAGKITLQPAEASSHARALLLRVAKSFQARFSDNALASDYVLSTAFGQCCKAVEMFRLRARADIVRSLESSLHDEDPQLAKLLLSPRKAGGGRKLV